MGVSEEQLKALADPMEYKYRLQSAKYNKATIVSYIDARAVYDRLDEICGMGNWKNNFFLIDDKLFCELSILVQRSEDQNLAEWVSKCDTGTENQMEKEKSQVSDALKRSAVLWGVGRFLYSLGIITLKAVKHTNDKEYPCTYDGKILWSVDDLTEYCKKLVAEGRLDDTKPRTGVNKVEEPKKPAAKAQPKKEEVKQTQSGQGIDEDWRIAAKKAFQKLDVAPIIRHLVNDLGIKKTVDQFIDSSEKEQVYALYNKFHIPETK